MSVGRRQAAKKNEQRTRKFEKLAQEILRMRGRRRTHVHVFLVGNQMLRDMKRKFLKKDARVVDVLAFEEPKNFPHPEEKEKCIGELYLNAAVVRKEPQHAVSLFIHGLLHLLGYRHGRPGDARVMTRQEGRLARTVFASRRMRPVIRAITER
ncbi:MAG: rRNA maturation RNase YbeY [Candidatus Liptonbacteria bacterium RIFCSPLOWO2_01_FULL_56_20]|uniref:rRNA maturation RNase YbeY n=1 Tax=Candidatus Liptonbacteria bacterium RIFCSPLOWO2_01_FULL_56_20 TaxID=1798652 RepID=A0A1G2CLR9_9BACT|nr:MAG: putative rRNA maturation factor [Parcubacteria group bacterium GW2011_GWB1_56_8]OGY97662.1 MAG: rRNA maturation RNase YbeY [Candidatus Liptonbacteria bacterium RIFCSPHIGHO2_01_FULL_56_18b]OGZ01601.1 MAG: rRNA maturation RNase YbeY [Candidatus Liptonbacteria bacterium RIFCSPLOWO2_01_FULL_56_20]